MTTTIGRCALTTNPYDFTQGANGAWSFSIEIDTIVDADVNEFKARRQQLLGLVGNVNEPIVPFTWSEDSTFDGWYAVADVTVPSMEAYLATAWTPDCRITLVPVRGHGNAAIETTVQAANRTNSHAITATPPVMGYRLPATVAEDNLGTLPTTTAINRIADNGQTIVALTATPSALTCTFRTVTTPALANTGACTVEILYGATWYPVIGRDIPLNTVWRIGNGIIRLTSANGATSGKLEIWDNGAGAYESINITHVTTGAVGPGIGLGTGSAQPTMSILRNGPEMVIVKCSTFGTSSTDMTYTIKRADHMVTASWYTLSATAQYGVGFTSAVASTTIGTYGLRATANDANGNRCVFGVTTATTRDVVNGRINASTVQASGTMMIGVELAGSGAIAGNTAASLFDQFFSVVAFLQRVNPR